MRTRGILAAPWDVRALRVCTGALLPHVARVLEEGGGVEGAEEEEEDVGVETEARRKRFDRKELGVTPWKRAVAVYWRRW